MTTAQHPWPRGSSRLPSPSTTIDGADAVVGAAPVTARRATSTPFDKAKKAVGEGPVPSRGPMSDPFDEASTFVGAAPVAARGAITNAVDEANVVVGEGAAPALSGAEGSSHGSMSDPFDIGNRAGLHESDWPRTRDGTVPSPTTVRGSSTVRMGGGS